MKPSIDELAKAGFTLQFLIINNNCRNLKGNTYNTPYSILFTSSVDILDFTDI